MEDQEHPLPGGNVSVGVVRIGSTVRRPVGPWTTATHALLNHLEQVGFPGSPRVGGIDDRGREILSFVPGVAAWPDHFDALASDAGLVKVARLIVAYHEAAASFDPPDGADWSTVCPTRGPVEVIRHNDLGPWNLILEPGGNWTFIDWDLASPGARISDYAYAARGFVPLFPDMAAQWPTVRRLRLLCDVWDVGPEELIDAVVWRARADANGLAQRAAAGEQPWRRMWDEGHGETNERIASHIERSAVTWLAELAG